MCTQTGAECCLCMRTFKDYMFGCPVSFVQAIVCGAIPPGLVVSA